MKGVWEFGKINKKKHPEGVIYYNPMATPWEIDQNNRISAPKGQFNKGINNI